MGQVISAFWNILNYEFVYENFSFSLWNVIEASIIISIFGYALGKIVFFVNNKR